MSYSKDKANALFEALKQMKEDLTEEETQEMTASIIEVFKTHNLTYSQAKQVLSITHDALDVMSETMSV